MYACIGWALAEALMCPSGGPDHFSAVLLPSAVLCVAQNSSSFTLDSSSHHHSRTKTACWSLMCSGCPAISRRPCRVMGPRLCRSPVNCRVIKRDRYKTLLAHKAAGVNIDLGSDLLCFFSQVHSGHSFHSQVSVPWCFAAFSFYSLIPLHLSLLFSLDLPCPPPPTPLCHFSHFSPLISWGFGWIIHSVCRAVSSRSPSLPSKSLFGTGGFGLLEKK